MLWTWRDKWHKTTFAKCADVAILACAGPSLAHAPKNLQGPQRTVFAINTAYPTVKPDYWIGMDKIYCYDANLLDESFPKLFRGSYCLMEHEGELVYKMPSTYFMDVAEVADDKTMFDLDVEKGFAWHNHTLGVALHFIVWMGAKKIYLLGCDLGGDKDYCHDLKLNEAHRARNQRLYAQQAVFIDKLSTEAAKRGIEFISATENSPLNKFLEYQDINDVLNIELKSHEVRYVLDKP